MEIAAPHPLLRFVLAMTYFRIGLSLVVIAVTPSLRTDNADLTNAVPVSERSTTETDPKPIIGSLQPEGCTNGATP